MKHPVRNTLLWLIVILIMGITAYGTEDRLQASNDAIYKNLEIFSDVIEEIEANYVDPVETETLIEKAIQGMVHSLDPHSSLLTPEAYKDLTEDTKGEFTGIGVVITMKKDMLTVISPIVGTPADRAGLQAGDVIIQVNDESTLEMTLSEAVKRIKGPKGTEVMITVMREGEAKPIEFSLVRDEIPLETVHAMMLKPGYGYVRITNFNENTTKDLNDALSTLEQENDQPLEGLVLDLRGNPGGLLNQSVQVADLFLESGDIVSIKGREDRHTEVYSAKPNRTSRQYPIVVLINSGSASASEIVAGALQDNKRALILGTTSFGKGSVQNVKRLKDNYALRLTIARYYTPSGRSIQAQGIEPDITLAYQRMAEAEKEKTKAPFSLTEKNLKNHLRPEGEKKEAQDTDTEDTPDKDEKPVERYGALDRDRLMQDNQVMHALEILIGHNVFKNLGA